MVFLILFSFLKGMEKGSASIEIELSGLVKRNAGFLHSLVHTLLAVIPESNQFLVCERTFNETRTGKRELLSLEDVIEVDPCLKVSSHEEFNKLKLFFSSDAVREKLGYISMHSSFDGTLPSSVFIEFKHLKSLYLDHAELTHLPADVFGGLRNLEILSLAYNTITQLPDGIFNSLVTLKYLDLIDNELSKLPESLLGLNNLEYLDIKCNKLTFLPSALFLQLTALKQAYWRDNSFDNHREIRRIYNELCELDSIKAGEFSRCLVGYGSGYQRSQLSNKRGYFDPY